ncbi:glycosyltransferase family 25 protein [Marinobacter nanhaiticus D15-8W]|uniref:Glycosyl transferase family 25 domain-containing protein n=1 Tax=Marinobacter nanhaiticus D15-8W TaxID=626887 RepID=N6WMR2_9GAMM|nr:glycosyltransferase family 25 protein [Marinobacter nanhaiticus]ENO12736.1 hypothetical protein J057_15090 [Marinobacter nanhaiticus D15-8W]BES70081.1 glycosyltransferase family 25 protein [Marinobacter nanhaiticus D15-8W]
MDIFVINMEKDTARLDFMRKQLGDMGLDFVRVDAVNGHTLPEIDAEAFRAARPRDGVKSWSRGKIGCFSSHFKAWEHCAKAEGAHSLIIEDDLHVSSQLKALLSSTDWIPEEADIIRLEVSTNFVRLAKKPDVTVADRNIFRLRSTSWCAGSYILKKTTAQKLINIDKKRHCPIDMFLFSFEDSPVARELNIFQCVPAITQQDKYKGEGALSLGSNIEKLRKQDSPLVRRLKELRNPAQVVLWMKKLVLNYRRVRFQ